MSTSYLFQYGSRGSASVEQAVARQSAPSDTNKKNLNGGSPGSERAAAAFGHFCKPVFVQPDRFKKELGAVPDRATANFQHSGLRF